MKAETSSADGKFTIVQQATKAEIITTLQYAGNNAPFSQAENLSACYQEQFPDSQIAQRVSISSNKVSYLVGYGLGLVRGNSFFTLHFDETVTAQTKEADGLADTVLVRNRS